MFSLAVAAFQLSHPVKLLLYRIAGARNKDSINAARAIIILSIIDAIFLRWIPTPLVPRWITGNRQPDLNPSPPEPSLPNTFRKQKSKLNSERKQIPRHEETHRGGDYFYENIPSGRIIVNDSSRCTGWLPKHRRTLKVTICTFLMIFYSMIVWRMFLAHNTNRKFINYISK